MPQRIIRVQHLPITTERMRQKIRVAIGILVFPNCHILVIVPAVQQT